MNNKSVKTLSAYAAGIQAITIVITYLSYVNQEAVKMFFSGVDEIVKVHTVPITYFIVSICPTVFYLCFAVFLGFSENRESVHRTGVVLFFVFACIAGIVMEYIPRIGSTWTARLGAAELASYSALGSAISMCTDPFRIVAFGLFALSAGGCLVKAKEQKNVNHYDGYPRLNE